MNLKPSFSSLSPPKAQSFPKASNQMVDNVVPAELEMITISVADSTSPIAGAKLAMPRAVSISLDDVVLGYEDTPPVAFNNAALVKGAMQVSKVISPRSANQHASNFRYPVKITIPYNKKLAGNISPSVVYWDDSSKLYHLAPVLQVDKVNGTVTCAALHFSRFIAVVKK